MKRLLFLAIIFNLSGCIFDASQDMPDKIELGALDSKQVWIYLCGLARDFNIPEEIEHRKIINQIGLDLNIKFIAIKPKNRCAQFDNKLCWPHQNKDETLATYQQILASIDSHPIAGYIGFSNGGFFLNQLAQFKELNQPVIAIGAAGYVGIKDIKNSIYLLIGTKDYHHYELAKNFYDQAQNSSLNVTLIEYDAGHVISQPELAKVLAALSKEK